MSRLIVVCWLIWQLFLMTGPLYAQSPQARLSLPQNTNGGRTSSGTALPISLDNTAVGLVRGVQIFLAFPPGAIDIIGVERTARTQGIDNVLSYIPQAGQVRIVIIDLAGIHAIESGTGPIVNLIVNPPVNAAPGTLIPLHFLQHGADSTAVFDGGGNLLPLITQDGTFTVTDTLPPVLLEGPTVTITTQHVVLIRWVTDELSTSIIEFGATPHYGSTVSDSIFVTVHQLTLPEVLADTTYYRLRSVDRSGNQYMSPGFFLSIPSGVNDPPRPGETPDQFLLAPNYPNPFNAGTTITFQVPRDRRGQAGQLIEVHLVIYNIMGQPVMTLFRGIPPAETYTVHWNGQDSSGHLVPSGVYFFRLEAGLCSQSRKMVLLR